MTMGICFYHEDFDADISSGTIHAIDQWSNLLSAFDIKKIAVINLTNDKLPLFSDTIDSQIFDSMDSFLDKAEGKIVCANPKGDINYKEANYKDIDWLVIGGSIGNGFKGGISIPTRGNRELYPREAAAIIIAEASWQLH